jgi:hypothetical protein
MNVNEHQRTSNALALIVTLIVTDGSHSPTDDHSELIVRHHLALAGPASTRPAPPAARGAAPAGMSPARWWASGW